MHAPAVSETIRLGLLAGVGGLDFAQGAGIPIPGTDIFKLHEMPSDIALIAVPRSGKFDTPLDLDRFDCILNTLTVPDLGAGGLQALAPLATAYSNRFLNAPLAVLRSKRDEVSRSLHHITNMIVPPAALFRGEEGEMRRAIQNAGVTFPAILRKAGTHLGQSMVLLGVPEEANTIIKPEYFYYMTSYVDYKSTDGLYRKYRFFFIGDTVILRHVLISDSWNVHAEARTRFMQVHPDLVAEEQAIMSADDRTEDRFASALQAVRRTLGLDFFGMDCSILASGELLLFEANSSMNFFDSSLDHPANWHLRERLSPARAAFQHMVSGDYVPAAEWQNP
jgi:hypothetical protein